MTEFRVSIRDGHDLAEVRARIEAAGHEVLARFDVFRVLLVAAPSAAELRSVEGVHGVELLQARAAA